MEAAVVVDGDDDDDDEVGFFFSSTVESMVFADRFVPLCCGEGSMSLSLSSSSLSSAINPRMPGCGNGLDAVAVGSVAFPPLPGAVEDPALTSSSESESLPYSPRASIVDRWMDGWMDGWTDPVGLVPVRTFAQQQHYEATRATRRLVRWGLGHGPTFIGNDHLCPSWGFSPF